MPFYSRLADLAKRHPNVRLVVATSLDKEIGTAYVRKHGLTVNDVVTINPSLVGLQGTPTLLLLNDRAVVSKVWVGKLPVEKESEVQTALLSAKL